MSDSLTPIHFLQTPKVPDCSWEVAGKPDGAVNVDDRHGGDGSMSCDCERVESNAVHMLHPGVQNVKTRYHIPKLLASFTLESKDIES